MEDALVAHLLAVPALADLVGDRINWSLRPQREALPAIVLTLVNATRGYTADGHDGLTDHLVRVECWGTAYGAAKDVAMTAIAAFEAVLPSPLIRAFIEGQREDAESGPDTNFYRTTLDVRVWAATQP